MKNSSGGRNTLNVTRLVKKKKKCLIFFVFIFEHVKVFLKKKELLIFFRFQILAS